MRVLPVENVNVNRGSIRVTRRNEGVLPPQSVPVSVSACGGVEACNERSFHVKYRSRGVHTSFYESAPSASDSLGNTIPPGDTQDEGNARADFPNASEERNLINISRHSRVLFKHIPASGGWHPVIDLKQLNHHINVPHIHMHTISSVLSTVKRGDYAFKIDLQVSTLPLRYLLTWDIQCQLTSIIKGYR